MKKILIGVSALAALVLPNLAFAQLDLSSLTDSISTLTAAVNALVPLGLAVAVIVFIYGIIAYLLAKKPDDQKAARGYIVWGIIGIAVILAVLGLAKLLTSLTGVKTGTGDVTGSDLPQVPESAG
jgi:hypothetical protein